MELGRRRRLAPRSHGAPTRSGVKASVARRCRRASSTVAARTEARGQSARGGGSEVEKIPGIPRPRADRLLSEGRDPRVGGRFATSATRMLELFIDGGGLSELRGNRVVDLVSHSEGAREGTEGAHRSGRRSRAARLAIRGESESCAVGWRPRRAAPLLFSRSGSVSVRAIQSAVTHFLDDSTGRGSLGALAPSQLRTTLPPAPTPRRQELLGTRRYRRRRYTSDVERGECTGRRTPEPRAIGRKGAKGAKGARGARDQGQTLGARSALAPLATLFSGINFALWALPALEQSQDPGDAFRSAGVAIIADDLFANDAMMTGPPQELGAPRHRGGSGDGVGPCRRRRPCA